MPKINITAQDAFDRMLAHLLKQGRRSMACEESDFCAYRTDDGLKCAVGALIPDELYDAKLEGFGASYLCKTRARPGSGGLMEDGEGLFSDDLKELLLDCQTVHDRNYCTNANDFADHAVSEFKKIASKYGLEWKDPR